MPKYWIAATPGQKVVAKGAKVDYRLDRSADYDHEVVDRLKAQWAITYSNTAQKHGGAPENIIASPTIRDDFTHTWKYEGKHQVHCLLHTGRGEKASDYKKGPAFFQQEVQSVDNILKLRKGAWQHPREMLNFAERYRDYLLKLGEAAPPTDSAALPRHRKELEKYALYHTRLKMLLSHYQDLADDEFLPVHARFHEKQSQETIDLNVFYIDLKYKMELVDWTDPGNPKEWGTHTEWQWPLDVIIKSWKSGNEYPPGHLQYFISRHVIQGGNATAKPQNDVKGLFETSKDSTWKTIAEYLGWAGAAAAIAAITVGVLVPGSAWVTGLIWTSLLSSSAEAVINIGVRMGERGSHWYEDLFDGLTILSNLFAAGALWKKGATVLAQPPKQKNVLKYLFYGEIVTNGVQGILITVEAHKELEVLMQDGGKTPSERTEEARGLMGKWGFSMAMMVVGLHASVKELKELSQAGINAGKLQNRLEQLGDPKAEPIDLTKPPSVDGHTKNGKVKTKTRDVQPGHTSKAKKQVDYKGKPALSPEKRGMRNRDDEVFAQHARDTDDIIIVRNSNPSALDYMGKKGHKPKPLTMKAKTRQTPPNKGLAAADPSDPRLQVMLKEKGITYEQYVKSIEADGFVVGPAKDGYLVMDKQGNKFYSDYDLHGVYDKNTGRNSYSEAKREQLNKDFGAELIQHPPHDNWPERNNPKMAPNDGPQGNSTAYVDGKAYHLETIADMKAFYEAFDLPWEEIYPNH